MDSAGRVWGVLAGCLGVVAALTGPTAAAELKVLSAGAVKAVVPDLAEQFRRETGHTVHLTFDTAGALRQRAMTEPADVLIITDAAIDDLARQGVVVPGTRTDVARVGIGVGVRQGAPVPDISTPDTLKQTLLSVRSLTYMDPTRGTSGKHVDEVVLPQLGIRDAVRAKATLGEGGFIAEKVARAAEGDDVLRRPCGAERRAGGGPGLALFPRPPGLQGEVRRRRPRLQGIAATGPRQ